MDHKLMKHDTFDVGHRNLKSEILKPSEAMAEPENPDKQLDSIDRCRVEMSNKEPSKSPNRN